MGGAPPQAVASVSSALRIFFIAATSIWRMRSALTPVLGRQVVQRHAAGAVVVDLQPALFDDAAAACVQHRQRLLDAVARQPVAVARFQRPCRLGAVVGQVGDGGVALFAVVGLGLERDVAAGQARLHLDHLVGLDVEFARDGGHLGRRQRVAVRVLVAGLAGGLLQALLHRAQVEEQLSLGLGRRDLDHAPVLQDVLVDLGLDPVQRVAHQAHALLGSKRLTAFIRPTLPSWIRSPCGRP